MEIYGLGLVALCMFIGSYIGELIGKGLGIQDNVGGVGFAMLLLVLYTNYREKSGKPLHQKTQNGIGFLSALYIPIVVAMSSIQNVVSAIDGGMIAFLSGVIATVGALALVPVLAKLVKKKGD